MVGLTRCMYDHRYSVDAPNGCTLRKILSSPATKVGGSYFIEWRIHKYKTKCILMNNESKAIITCSHYPRACVAKPKNARLSLMSHSKINSKWPGVHLCDYNQCDVGALCTFYVKQWTILSLSKCNANGIKLYILHWCLCQRWGGGGGECVKSQTWWAKGQ